MFEQNFNTPYMMPNMYAMPSSNFIPRTSLGGTRSLLGINSLSHGSHGIFSSLRNLNFPNILNNASRTLGVVKEAIPIVKEVRPMLGNMRSMLKIASVFKDETDTTPNVKTKENSINTNNLQTENINTISNNYNNQPNFFL